MSVPDRRHLVARLFEQGGFILTTKEGAGRFTEAAATALHAVDANWGHLRKPEGRTHVVDAQGNRHAVDVVLYKATGQIVDIIVHAGELGARLGWGVGPEHEYSEADWYAPGGGPPVDDEHEDTPPAVRPYWGDAANYAITRPLFRDYARAGQFPNDGMGVWMGRTLYDVLVRGENFDTALARHRAEWCAILGIPVE